ncbi:hypothetical protein C671_1623 [[Clostridium] bifermentans ATCC 19299]|nr:hypothetical protein C671_1623 [[Clostridium] bifermentans ATCC 19299] [Paraclostridium bifermentans ATCC 19299]
MKFKKYERYFDCGVSFLFLTQILKIMYGLYQKIGLIY